MMIIAAVAVDDAERAEAWCNERGIQRLGSGALLSKSCGASKVRLQLAARLVQAGG